MKDYKRINPMGLPKSIIKAIDDIPFYAWREAMMDKEDDNETKERK